MYDVIIIGSGPAGLTAAIYTSRARLRTLVIEKPSVISQAGYADLIENYPGFPEGISGARLINKIKEQAGNFGTEYIEGSVEAAGFSKIKKSDTWEIKLDNSSYNCLSIIIASGAKAKRLAAAGEERLIGRGVSYCATCDGAFFKDKNVVVVGGGDTAAEEALFLTRFARKVMLIHRRDKLRATRILQEKLLSNKKIEIIWSSTAEEILGDKNVEGLKIRERKTSGIRSIECDGVFISIGFIPNTDFIRGIVKLNKDGRIITNEKMETSRRGIFACGDCRDTPFKQIITACGDGALTAFFCRQYIEKLKGIEYR